MNRTLKRVLGLSGSVVLGLAGAVAFASGAQAHHPEIQGITECTPDGGWTVVWQVKDWDSDNGSAGKITEILTDGEFNEGTEIVVGASLPAFDSGDYLEGSQNFSADVDLASITIKGEWDNGAKGETSSTVSAPEGGCTEEPPAEPEPEYEFGGGSDCVGVYVWADNYNPDALAEFTFAPSNGDAVTYTPEVDEGFYEYFYVDSAEEGLTVDIFVGEELVDTIEWYDNELCSYIAVESDCDGLTITLTVPADGEETYFEVYADTMEEPLGYTLAAGESEVVEIPAAGEEFWAWYYIETPKDATGGELYWAPCDEETPSPSGTPSAQPQLPTTGSSMTIMIGSAAALIVAAAAIFLIMRRRRAAQDW
ncbi:LPXTG cell wall anchor domain-containing protein [Glycomyces niveus]|jgi:LPXTG-motif cell wall-anchored protein|uniref:LPXTG cell wall anchor domain-containing protein n=1 Tax=Glycomyces niveus TaxID=2820287 RepID=A0ABS3TXK1_9ACTN|nr:LPXTG cell wall anchor domain-containing protein [Glycomyces sp. NEAU-S30]MBO3731241.1 LPXTG cell wall anchor domain-containing protein [Glycomyces sp. NEAU-S30]